MRKVKNKFLLVSAFIVSLTLCILPFTTSTSSSISQTNVIEQDVSTDHPPIGGASGEVGYGYSNIEILTLDGTSFSYRIKGQQSSLAQLETFGWAHASHLPGDAHGIDIVDPSTYETKTVSGIADFSTASKVFEFSSNGQRIYLQPGDSFIVGQYSTDGGAITYGHTDLATVTLGGITDVTISEIDQSTFPTYTPKINVDFVYQLPTATWNGLDCTEEETPDPIGCNVLSPTWTENVSRNIQGTDTLTAGTVELVPETGSAIINYQNYTNPSFSYIPTTNAFNSGHTYSFLLDIDADGDYQTTAGSGNVSGGSDSPDFLVSQNLTLANEYATVTPTWINAGATFVEVEFLWNGTNQNTVYYQIYKYDKSTNTTDWASGPQGTLPDGGQVSVEGNSVGRTSLATDLDSFNDYIIWFGYEGNPLPTDSINQANNPYITFYSSAPMFEESSGVVGQEKIDDNGVNDKVDDQGYNQFTFNFEVGLQMQDPILIPSTTIYAKIVNEGADPVLDPGVDGQVHSYDTQAAGNGYSDSLFVTIQELLPGSSYDIWLSYDDTFADLQQTVKFQFVTDQALSITDTYIEKGQYTGLTNAIVFEGAWNSNQAGEIYYSVDYEDITTTPATKQTYTDTGSVVIEPTISHDVVVKLPQGYKINSLSLSMFDPAGTTPPGYSPTTITFEEMYTGYEIEQVVTTNPGDLTSGDVQISLTYKEKLTTPSYETISIKDDDGNEIYNGSILLSPTATSSSYSITNEGDIKYTFNLSDTTANYDYMFNTSSDGNTSDNTLQAENDYKIIISKYTYDFTTLKLNNISYTVNLSYKSPTIPSTKGESSWMWLLILILIIIASLLVWYWWKHREENPLKIPKAEKVKPAKPAPIVDFNEPAEAKGSMAPAFIPSAPVPVMMDSPTAIVEESGVPFVTPLPPRQNEPIPAPLPPRPKRNVPAPEVIMDIPKQRRGIFAKKKVIAMATAAPEFTQEMTTSEIPMNVFTEYVPVLPDSMKIYDDEGYLAMLLKSILLYTSATVDLENIIEKKLLKRIQNAKSRKDQLEILKKAIYSETNTAVKLQELIERMVLEKNGNILNKKIDNDFIKTFLMEEEQSIEKNEVLLSSMIKTYPVETQITNLLKTPIDKSTKEYKNLYGVRFEKVLEISDSVESTFWINVELIIQKIEKRLSQITSKLYDIYKKDIQFNVEELITLTEMKKKNHVISKLIQIQNISKVLNSNINSKDQTIENVAKKFVIDLEKKLESNSDLSGVNFIDSITVELYALQRKIKREEYKGVISFKTIYQSISDSLNIL